MMISNLQSGKVQVHEVGGHASEDKKINLNFPHMKYTIQNQSTRSVTLMIDKSIIYVGRGGGLITFFP